MKKTFLFTCLLIFSACTKDDNITIADGIYASNGTIQMKPAILYTKNGPVTDPGIINAYLQRNALTPVFNLKSGNDTTSGQITFTFSGTTATSKEDSKTYNVVYKSADIALLVEQDTSWTISDDMNQLNCQNVGVKIRQNSATRTCNPIPGGGQYCSFLQQFPVTKNGNNLSLTRMSFCFTQSFTGNALCKATQYNTPDFLNTAMLSELQTTDTLLVQTSTLPLYKK
jgi:hypothetical protein